MITLRVREPVDGEEDDFGNVQRTWEERDWVVRSIAPGSMEDQDRTTRDLSLILWTVYADADSGRPTELGQVRLPGGDEWYTVEGRPADWTFGPDRVGTRHDVKDGPGIVVELRRAEG